MISPLQTSERSVPWIVKMGTKIYVDTNVVADMIDSSRKGHDNALKLLSKLIMEDTTLCISEDMLSTLYYISKEKKATLAFFENVVYEDWKVLPFGLTILKEATKISMEKNVDLEDLLQCLCAKENNCTKFITEDKKFYPCGLEINTVEQFLT